METQTSEARRPIGGRRRREGERRRGRGQRRDPRAQGRKREGRRGGASRPPCTLATLSVPRAASSALRARARQQGARSPDPPLKRPLGEAPPVPVGPSRANLRSCARARPAARPPARSLARPPSGSPRAASRDRAQPRRQRRPREHRRLWQRQREAAAPPAWSGRCGGVEKKGASDRNG